MPGISVSKIPIPFKRAGISWSSYWTHLIMSMNPVFWIEDMSVVEGGYLVDSSGNNKQIAVSTQDVENDTITMPANDAEIIAALIADNSYRYWYTDDATPIAHPIGNILHIGSRQMYSYYLGKNFLLFPSALTQEQQEDLYGYLSIPLAYLPDVNMCGNIIQGSNINRTGVVSGYGVLTWNRVAANVVWSDNVFAWSASKKTLTKNLSGSSVKPGVSLDYAIYSGGSIKISFWVDRTQGGATDTTYCASTANSFTGRLNWINAADASLNDINYVKVTTLGSVTSTCRVKDIQGDWTRIEVDFVVQSSNAAIWSELALVSFYLGLYKQTADAYDSSMVDPQMTKDYNGDFQSGVLLEAPYQKMGSNLLGKTICIIGDSVSTGNYSLYMQFLYGLKEVINAAKAGRRIAHLVPNDLWQDRATVVAQPADIFIILASANDNSSVVGTIDDVDTTTYGGGYNEYLTYLIANKPAGSDVVLVTSPFTIGTGNTLAEGKVLFEQHFIDMANVVKAAGVKFNLPVCDLHGTMPMTWDNANIYLSDGVHWRESLHFAAGHIIGKFVNDLFEV